MEYARSTSLNVFSADSVSIIVLFGAIASKTSIVDVINEIRAGKKVVTMLAPAGEGQFGENITMASWKTAMKKLGFAMGWVS